MSVKKMLSISVMTLLFSAMFSYGQDTIRTNIIIDSLENEIYYLTTKDKKPFAYYSPVFTPVCVDGTCYPIKINLFWDLAGNYLKYTLDSTEILTKVDHIPFSSFDYGLLHRVIANQKSALANFTIYELTDENESKVDGVTGATRAELQGAFVPDALYTSYTLWHLVRKPLHQIEKYTKNHIFESVYFNHVLSNPQLGGQELALQCLINKSNSTHIVSLLGSIIDTTDNELTEKCLKLIPKQNLEITQSRALLTRTYLKSNSTGVKTTILTLWSTEMEITPLELEIIASELGNQSATYRLEEQILLSYEKWPESLYHILLEKIEQSSNMMRKERLKQLLYKRETDFSRKFKRNLKRS